MAKQFKDKNISTTVAKQINHNSAVVTAKLGSATKRTLTAVSSNANSNRTNSSLGSQYDVVLEDEFDLTGRLVLQNNPLKYYTEGTPEGGVFEPFENETALDDNGNVYTYIKDSNGVLSWVSVDKNITDKIKAWEDAGVIDKYNQFVENGKIFRLYSDNTNLVVRSNTDISYPLEVKYYTIRKTTLNTDGTKHYVAGMRYTTSDGSLYTVYLQDMTEVISNVDPSLKYMIMGPGSLLEPLNQGETYLVEFYNSEKLLIDSRAYQNIVSTFIGDLVTPDEAVTGLQVTTNRDIGGGQGVRLYVDEDPNAALAIRVFLLYGQNNLPVDITDELESGGRLTIDGLDEIDTSKPTNETNLNQYFTVTYHKQTDNSTPAPSENDTVISGNTLYKQIPVIIEEDTNIKIINKIVPISWVEGDPIVATSRVMLKIYGLYEDGVLRDITYGPIHTLTSPIMDFVYNSATDAYEATSDKIGTPTDKIRVEVKQGSSTNYKSFSFDLKTNTNTIMVTIETLTRRLSLNPNTNKMGFFGDTQSSLTTRNSMQLSDGSVIAPTHFTIRNAKNFQAIYAERIPMASFASFTYSISQGNQPQAEYPFIAVFEYLQIGDSGEIISKFTTGNDLYFALFS